MRSQSRAVRRTRPSVGPPTAVAATVVLLALASWSCSEDLAEVTALDKLRILGVRATQPALAEGETATLDALVFDPQGREVSYAWSWCPARVEPTAGFPCPVTQQAFDGLLLGAGLDPSEFPPLALGSEPTATWAYPGSPASVKRLCQLISADLPTGGASRRCDEPLVVTIKLRVHADDDELVAIRSLSLLPTAEGQNHNPELLAWSARPAGGGESVALVDGATLDRGATYTLLASTADDSAEHYRPPPRAQAPPPSDVQEGLILSWYSAGGAHAASRTGTAEGEVSLEAATQTVWTAPTGVDEAVLFVVLRDDRGGMDWLGARVNLAP